MSDPAQTTLDPAAPSDDPSQLPASRRTVLRAAGLVALAGTGGAALAGCSTDPSATPAASSAPPSAAASSPSAAASSSAASPSSAASSASASTAPSVEAPDGPSVPAAEVPVGGGFIMPNDDYVVTQPTKGEFKAFNKKCTHQGCPVSQIADQEIVCRCHNSHFSIKDGSPVSGPAKAPLASATATLSGKNVVVTA